MNLYATKVVRDWDGNGILTGRGLNLSDFRPGPGSVARLVLPHATKGWTPDVPGVIARAVAHADDWHLDFTGRPQVIAPLVREVQQALAALRATA